MMSNCSKIFLHLLIMVTMYQYSRCQFLVAPMAELYEVLAYPSDRISYTSSLFQYEDQDRFYIYDPDPESTLSSVFNDEFSSSAIEICSYHNCEFKFLYRRSKTEILRFKCSFPHADLAGRFFHAIYNYQKKGVFATIFKIARYFNNTGQLQLFATQVTVYTKDISLFVGHGAAAKTYSISRYSPSTERIEPALIFHSGTFAISTIHNGYKIALCLRSYPNERFLIAFTGQVECQKFIRYHAQDKMQLEGLTCDFPTISDQEEAEFLNTKKAPRIPKGE